MKPRLVFLILLLVACCSAHAQIPVSGRQFVRSPKETGPKGEWVLYEKGAPQDEGSRRWLTRQVLVELEPGKSVEDLKKLPGVAAATARGKFAVVEFSGRSDAALSGATALKKLPGVKSAEPMLSRQLFRRLVPNDPLFAHNPASQGYQWHLRNTGQNDATAGIDLKVVDAWDNYLGTGVRIGIVDDGLETSHADLAANVDLINGYDFNDLDTDPSPGPSDFHGTACAGVAAARGNNGIGGSGTAPQATLVGMRLIAAPTTDLDEANAFAFKKDIVHIKSNSWGPYDGAYGSGGPGPLSLAAMQDAVTTGRDGKGTVFLWAAGNGNGTGDDSNYDGWANWPHAIAVGAITDRGRSPWYGEPGVNILVCAPSNGKQGITTTDRSGSAGYNTDGGTVEHPDFADTDYTNSFGGTSSSTPAVAGVVALMLEANPNLTYRDVQEILVRTAVQNDFYNGSWVTNGAGLHFHPYYGAGLVNATAATAMAASWTNVPPLQLKTQSQAGLALPIPDADDAGLSRSFTVTAGDNLRLEHVTVQVKATHPYAGNLEWRLTSPSGVTARLARSRFNDTSANLNWTFMATHFWGERSEGVWKVEVFDRMVDYTGTLDEVTITFHGTPAPAGLPLPVITSSWIIAGREGWQLNHQVTASNFATSFDTGIFFSGNLPSGLSFNPVTGLISGVPDAGLISWGFQGATNATGSVSDNAIFYILSAVPALSEAVDQPVDTKIIPFGYGDPFYQTETTHDGIDAIETEAVDHDEYSGIEFTVNGPARLDFQWKVSSEKNFDYLVLVVDGYVRDYITGEIDWTPSSTYLGDGPHNVDIYYIKDQAEVQGQDKGWIDEVVITPTNSAPVITPQIVKAYQGVYFRHQLQASFAPSSYSADDLPAGLTLHAPSGLIYGSVATVGNYPVTIHATNSSGIGTETITIQVGTLAQGLADALDWPSQLISTSGDKPWVPQTLYSSDGEDAARSGAIDNLQRSTMTTDITGPCKVTFYWGVSSEKDYDYLRFHIDDVEQTSISGEVGWTRKEFLIPSGTHTLKWEYRKDDFVANGLDSGFVDRLETHLDLDGDGVYSDVEQWFGTSDNDPSSRPTVIPSSTPIGISLDFPSVSGNNYRIEISEDLILWNPVFVTATGSMTSWIDRNSLNKSRRFYRVLIP